MRRRAIAWFLVSTATACTGWVEDGELSAPEDPIEAANGYTIVPSDPAPPEPPVERESASRCETTMQFMESEDGTTPRQRAMFAPEPERETWARIRRWFGRAGVSLPEDAGIYAFGALELGRALGEPTANYDCARIVELDGREAAVCTRTAIVEHAIVRDRMGLAVDWVLVFAEADGLVPVVVGPHAAGGIGFDTKLEPPLDLLPYVRLDLVVVDAARGHVRIEEAAPGVCEYACAHAKEVERRNAGNDPLAARETAEIGDTCRGIGSYVVRGTTVARQ